MMTVRKHIVLRVNLLIMTNKWTERDIEVDAIKEIDIYKIC